MQSTLNTKHLQVILCVYILINLGETLYPMVCAVVNVFCSVRYVVCSVCGVLTALVNVTQFQYNKGSSRVHPRKWIFI